MGDSCGSVAMVTAELDSEVSTVVEVGSVA